MSSNIFGIDLGTTNSAIALFEDDNAHVVKNIEGFEVTPSVVYFSGVDSDGNDEIIVGQLAKNAAPMQPDKTVQFVKRLMGSKGFAYNFSGPSGKEYTPEMISSIILTKLCKDAEQYYGEGAVKDVVITVPAYFDDSRRVATKQAGEIAGLNVLRVLNEPTAAAIAFGVDKAENGTVVVYDLGGGTFDVTVMSIKDGKYDVIATGGDSQLGGMNFDQKLVSIIINKLEAEGCIVDEEDDATWADIREKAEDSKCQLSSVLSARPFFTIAGKTYRLEITRDEFEKASEELLERTKMLLEEVFSENNLSWDKVDYVLPVGGSTKMPMVKEMLEKISGKEIKYRTDPDTAVAIGAAVFAQTLSTNESDRNNEKKTDIVSISDVTSQSLGVVTINSKTDQRENTIIIPRNTKIPSKKSQIVYTRYDNQQEILIEVTEGNDPELEFVDIIGSSTLSIPEYPKGSPVEVIYAYDPDQTIYIEVIDKVTNNSLGTFEIERSANLSENEVMNAKGVVNNVTVD